MKIRPVRVELFMRAGGQTYGHDETTVAFCSFTNGPKNGRYAMVWERVDWIELAQDKKRSVKINFIALYCTFISERLRKTMLKPSKGGECVTTGFEQNPSDMYVALVQPTVVLFLCFR